MRDVIVTLLILSTLPMIFRHPWKGSLVSLWVSLMAPHHLTWGFAYNLPFVAIVVAATGIGIVFTKDKVKLPINATTVVLMVFALWMSFTLLFALEPTQGFKRWSEVMKIMVVVLATAALLQERKQIEWLLWVIVISVGFYGVKGGLFTVLTGGGSRVWGPPDSFIADNNAISVALVMTIPLMGYLRTRVDRKWMRLGLLVAMMLSGMAVLGSQSRGAFLAIAATGFFLWLHSRRKAVFLIAAIVLVPLAIGFMPASWTERMQSIETYQQDASALGRLNAWHAAYNVAKSRITGGGFEWHTWQSFQIYAPDPTDVHSAHSIYFQVLGEHGFIGLFLFLVLGIIAWRDTRKIIAAARGDPSLAWAEGLARAIQVSLIGFAAGGLFVNIAYWELQYYELIALMLVRRMVTAPKAAAADAAPPGQAAAGGKG